MNPNRCETCDYKYGAESIWCYMWKNPPSQVCAYHTTRLPVPIAKLIADAEKAATDISKENTDGNQD